MNKIGIEHNLSREDFRLYDFLKEQSDWIKQKDIALAMPNVFPCTIEDMQDFHNAAARHSITKSIRRLNESGYVDKIILSGAKGVKIATEEEFSEYIGANIMAATNRLKRLKNMMDKAGRNGQLRIKLSEYQNGFYSAFNNKEMSK